MIDANESLNTNSEIPLAHSKCLQAFASDVRAGLTSRPKSIPPKYFYDELGSKLFEQICQQPEYYLTRVEVEILKKHATDIVKELDRTHANIIELGSGTSVKTRILFRALLSGRTLRKNQVYYFPIDISGSALQEMTNMLSGDFANLRIREIISDYNTGLELACKRLAGKKVSKSNVASKMILFLGSSIGNLEPAQCINFFKMVRDKMSHGDSLLVGFDLEKETKILEYAYNDSQGVTSRFNMNILKRINNELGGNFDLTAFQHFSFYNRIEHRIEMHLISKSPQKIQIAALPNEIFEIAAKELIHTENSYKYSIKNIERLATKTGFKVKKHYVDAKGWYDLCLLKPE
jgi:L-histidine N-alpha-methyltransferase